jgi:hypothetical protein
MMLTIGSGQDYKGLFNVTTAEVLRLGRHVKGNGSETFARASENLILLLRRRTAEDPRWESYDKPEVNGKLIMGFSEFAGIMLIKVQADIGKISHVINNAARIMCIEQEAVRTTTFDSLRFFIAQRKPDFSLTFYEGELSEGINGAILEQHRTTRDELEAFAEAWHDYDSPGMSLSVEKYVLGLPAQHMEREIAVHGNTYISITTESPEQGSTDPLPDLLADEAVMMCKDSLFPALEEVLTGSK